MPSTPSRHPRRPDPTALPDPGTLPWRPLAVDERADPAWAASLPDATPAERCLIETQIGRPLRGRVAVAARCRFGLPVVARTAPHLPDGTPFPTLYWLTCPAARVAIGRLEAAGWNSALTERIKHDEAFAEAQRDAYASYIAQRDALGDPLPGDPAAGGLPDRVKCLHALYAHDKATGTDPAGQLARALVDPIDCPGPCVDGGTTAGR